MCGDISWCSFLSLDVLIIVFIPHTSVYRRTVLGTLTVPWWQHTLSETWWHGLQLLVWFYNFSLREVTSTSICLTFWQVMLFGNIAWGLSPGSDSTYIPRFLIYCASYLLLPLSQSCSFNHFLLVTFLSRFQSEGEFAQTGSAIIAKMINTAPSDTTLMDVLQVKVLSAYISVVKDSWIFPTCLRVSVHLNFLILRLRHEL